MESTKKEAVRDMFDSIAPKYDLLNHLLSFGIDRRWRRRMAVGVASRKPVKILDIAAGTGDVALTMAKMIPEATITGIDLSAEMLAIGRRKVESKGLQNRIVFVCGDAERLPFQAGVFDAVTIGFGIRNFGNLKSGLEEAHRVLSGGGMLSIVEFSTPQGRLFGPLYRFYFHNILPLVGRIVSKDSWAYTYLPRSVDQFPDNLLFLQIMEQSGFTECRARRQTCGIAYIYEGKKNEEES